MRGARMPGLSAGSAMRKRHVVLLLFIGATAAVWISFAPRYAAPLSAAPERTAQRAETQEARTAALPLREALGKLRGEMFTDRSRVAPPAAPTLAAPPIERVPRPLLPYRYAGKLLYEGTALIVLAKGNTLFFAKQGETLEDRYRVESISGERITFLYLPLGVRDTLTMDAALSMTPASAAATGATAEPASPQRARLRWEGPKTVQAGRPFEVALRVNSPQPVYSSPLQLTYDAQALKPLEVRAGAHFAAGEFTSRISLNGSILIGGSGSSGAAGDAEFFVITFMPTRAGGTAALNVAAGSLRSEAGAAIEYDPPPGFRAPIE